MNLSESRFYKGFFNVRIDGEFKSFRMYSYETHDALYDVMVYAPGQKYYRKNCGVWSCTIDQITPIHAAIEAHFGLMVDTL